MSKKNRHDPVPPLPIKLRLRLRGRDVALVEVGDDGLTLSVVLCCDPAGVSGADKERLAAVVHKRLPRVSHEAAYAALWKPEA